MDTYRSPLNKRINHAMLMLHSYLSLAFTLPATTGGRTPALPFSVSLVRQTTRVENPISRCCGKWVRKGGECAFFVPSPGQLFGMFESTAVPAVAIRLVLWVAATVLLPTQKVYVGPGTSLRWAGSFGASLCPWSSISLAAFLVALAAAVAALHWMSGGNLPRKLRRAVERISLSCGGSR